MAKTLINEFVQIPYHPKTFESEKFKKIREAVLSPFITFIEVEGAIRGGKDVSVLNAYSEYLMLTPDKLHLVTGTSENHAIETVLNSDGFGLMYLLPHGSLTRVNNKMKFLFTDFFGVQKEIHFFGLVNYNDHEAFRGITYGSHYANEATKQSVIGLQVAMGRTSAAKWRKIIHTQNPTAPASSYYVDFEQPLIANEIQAMDILKLKTKYQNEYNGTCSKYDKILEDRKKVTIKNFLKNTKVENYSKLTPKEQKNLRVMVLRTQVDTMLERENELYTKYKITSSHLRFEPYYENPNNVRNGLNFRYFHYTMKDNPSISDARFSEISASYNTKSVHYSRDILGKRAIADDAIYDNLTEENFYNIDLPNNLKDYGWMRYIYIDYGVRNAFVMLDCYLHPETFTCFVENEKRFVSSEDEHHRSPSEKLYGELLKEFLHSRENGRYDGVGVDPSARGFINYLNDIQIYVKKAKNVVSLNKKSLAKDQFLKDKNLDDSIDGIQLVKTGFDYKKIYINTNKCLRLRQELESYSLDPKKKMQGIEVPLKVNDHGADALRYFINTEIRRFNKWQIGKEVNIFEEIERIRQEQNGKSER